MRLLLFDTETTGLPKSKESATRAPNNWPHLVSLAWIVLENDQVVKEEYHVVKPEWEIPSESSKIHGITQEYAETHGEPLADVIDKFLQEPYDLLIAHNMEFDFNVICNAILWDLWKPLPVFGKRFCTMNTGRNICCIPSQYYSGYKLPKLTELYEFVTGQKPNPSQLHNSLYDTQLLKEIILKSTVIRSILGLNTTSVTNGDGIYTQKSRVLTLSFT